MLSAVPTILQQHSTTQLLLSPTWLSCQQSCEENMSQESRMWKQISDLQCMTETAWLCCSPEEINKNIIFRELSSSYSSYHSAWVIMSVHSFTPTSQLTVKHRQRQASAIQICPGWIISIHSWSYQPLLYNIIHALPAFLPWPALYQAWSSGFTCLCFFNCLSCT